MEQDEVTAFLTDLFKKSKFLIDTDYWILTLLCTIFIIRAVHINLVSYTINASMVFLLSTGDIASFK